MYKGPYVINPVEEYRLKYLPLFQKKVEELLERDAVLSGVDPEVSRKQNRLINNLDEERHKSINKFTLVMLRFLLMAFLITMVGGIFFLFIEEADLNELFLLITIPICGVPLFFLIKKMGPDIIDSWKESDRLEKEIKETEKDSISYLGPLAVKLRSENLMWAAIGMIPPVNPDLFMTAERAEDLMTGFNYKDSADNENESVLELLSGSLGASPFVLEKRYSCHMENVTYTGSTSITWTETETYVDDKGKKCTRDVQRSQTLTASVTRPAPVYHKEWHLNIMSDRAASVCFTHKPTVFSFLRHTGPLRNTALEDSRHILNIQKVSGDAIEYGIMFNPLSVAAIHALQNDREYGYGDDFTIVKDGPILKVSSKHFEKFEFNSPVRISTDWYDYETLKQEFISNSVEYFRSLYFAFAPALAFDIYQRFEPVTKCRGQENYDKRPSDIEVEHIVNRLLNRDSCICKVNTIQKRFGCWEVIVDLHTFECANFTEVFSVSGGDGKSHDVVVPYTEFYSKSEQLKVYFRTDMDNVSIEDIKQQEFPFMKDIWNLDVRSRILSFRADCYCEEDDEALNGLILKNNKDNI